MVWRMVVQRTSIVLAVAFSLAGLLAADVGAMPTQGGHRQSSTVRAASLVSAARAQIGVTRFYDGAYAKLSYPNGDVAQERGVCTDVVIRAYRKAFGYDLQKAVHQDMASHFSAYPKFWGSKAVDANIDHRRVPNLQAFFSRRHARLEVSDAPDAYLPGDLVTQMVSGRLPHIVIVSDRRSADGRRPLIIHNIGAGAKEEDGLFGHPITGHYRYLP